MNENIQCLDAFLKEVKQELSVSCQLPVNIPTKEIIRIIKYAKKFFLKHYEYSTEDVLFVIDESAWDTPDFKDNRYVILPDEIYSVHGVYEVGRENFGSRSFSAGDSDFSIDKFIYGDIYSPSAQSENLMYYTINEKFYSLARQMLVSKLSFTFSNLTHKFRFQGELPKEHVVLEAQKSLSDCEIMQDELFYRYVIAQCKVQISRVLGTFNYELPGGITIQYDIIRDEGKEDLDEIKTELKESEGTDWFFVG